MQPEVLFSVNRVETSNSVAGQPIQTDYELGYLSIPVLAKFYFPLNSKLESSLYAGPQLGFSLYGDANDIEIDDSMTDTEFSVALGGGLDLLTAKQTSDLIQRLGLDLRYTFGLTDSFDIEGDPEIKNGAFTAAISIGF